MDIAESVLKSKKVIRDMEETIANASSIDNEKLYTQSVERLLRPWHPLVNLLDEVCNDSR